MAEDYEKIYYETFDEAIERNRPNDFEGTERSSKMRA